MTDSLDVVVYLVRHGRTQLNVGGRLRGRLDVPLDEVGRVEAESLAALFAEVHLAAAVASPLSRAVDTARAIADPLGLVVEVADDLADRDWGRWSGCLESDVVTRFGRVDAAPGVEPTAAFGRRVVGAVEHLASGAHGRRVLAVAHDAVNRAVLATLVPELEASTFGQRTGCWNQLLCSVTGWSAPVVDAIPGDGRAPYTASV